MRVHETDGISAMFCGDIPGGYQNECPCGERQDVISYVDGKRLPEADKPFFCPCGKEIVYRPWYEW